MGACSSRNDIWDGPDGRHQLGARRSDGIIDHLGGASANAASNNAVTAIVPDRHRQTHYPNFLMEMNASDHARARPRRRRRGDQQLTMRGGVGGIRHHHGNGRYDDEIRLAEIMALQQSLAAMEDFFQSLLGQANFYMDAFDPQNGGGNRGPPPASTRVLEELPDIASESKHTEVLCGICGEEIAETRLPCGHAFHKGTCVEPWLTRHCTCPVCRYELPTDDASYEPGRIERMSSRKIEVRPPVLETISAKEKEDEAMMLYSKTESTETYDAQSKEEGVGMISEVDVEAGRALTPNP
jgi:hypothetical protein